MGEQSKERHIAVVGIDLAKRSFHGHGVDGQVRQVPSKQLARARLSPLMANLPACTVAMEACGSAHHWARQLRTYGHEVRLIAPQFVEPFVKSNNNDAADAEAMCEAAQRPNMRFVAVETVEQQDIRAIHRMRSLVVAQRSAQIDKIRGLLLEYGIEIPQGRAALRRRLPEILEDADNGLSARCRAERHGLAEALCHLDERVAHDDAEMAAIAQSNAQARVLASIPGIGAKGATALVAAVGAAPTLFKNGRGLAAWLGLVARQHSAGGRERLLGIGKRSDVYRRQWLIHGARAVLRWIERKKDRTRRWATALKARRHTDIAVVAMANKIARIAQAVMATGKPYDPTMAALAKA
jgi:transposase